MFSNAGASNGLFIVLLLLHTAIGFTVVVITLLLNLRRMRDRDVDWRMLCSWVSLAVFTIAVVANALWDKGPISVHRVWELSVFDLAAFGLAFTLSIVGRGLGRVLIAITSLVFCWLYYGGALHHS
jgi:hypothetical protein